MSTPSKVILNFLKTLPSMKTERLEQHVSYTELYESGVTQRMKEELQKRNDRTTKKLSMSEIWNNIKKGMNK